MKHVYTLHFRSDSKWYICRIYDLWFTYILSLFLPKATSFARTSWQFTTVIFTHYKPRIAVAILDLWWIKMIWSGWKIEENCHVLVNKLHWNFRSKTLCCRKIKSVFGDVKWCFNASWGLKGLKHCINCLPQSYLKAFHVSSNCHYKRLAIIVIWVMLLLNNINYHSAIPAHKSIIFKQEHYNTL